MACGQLKRNGLRCTLEENPSTWSSRLPSVTVRSFGPCKVVEILVEDGSPRRKEVWEIPMVAIREAVVNAVLHRDYDDPGNVQICIFDDRLEVWSPGLLVGTPDLATLGDEARSVPRNRNLVRLAKSLGLVEAWGTGFQRMSEECRRAGLPAPQWRHSMGAFVSTFFKKKFLSEGVSERSLLGLIRARPGLHTPQLAVPSAQTPDRGIRGHSPHRRIPRRCYPKRSLGCQLTQGERG